MTQWALLVHCTRHLFNSKDALLSFQGYIALLDDQAASALEHLHFFFDLIAYCSLNMHCEAVSHRKK